MTTQAPEHHAQLDTAIPEPFEVDGIRYNCESDARCVVRPMVQILCDQEDNGRWENAEWTWWPPFDPRETIRSAP